MINKELLSRINALAKKQKTIGLTLEEKQEQDSLRKSYLEAIRGQVEQQLSQIRFEDE